MQHSKAHCERQRLKIGSRQWTWKLEVGISFRTCLSDLFGLSDLFRTTWASTIKKHHKGLLRRALTNHTDNYQGAAGRSLDEKEGDGGRKQRLNTELTPAIMKFDDFWNFRSRQFDPLEKSIRICVEILEMKVLEHVLGRGLADPH